MSQHKSISFKNKSSKIEYVENDKLGSSIEFKPVIETEVVSKGRLKYNLILKYQSITCMNEYLNKSFEELKFEDYQTKRKHSERFLHTTISLAITNPFFNNTISIAALDSAPYESNSFNKTNINQDFVHINSIESSVPNNLQALSDAIVQLEDLKLQFFYNMSTNNVNIARNLKQYSNKSSIIDIHPTGITLTRPDYYTIPSLHELINFINIDGSCIVQGFTVGRHGYGSVYFPDTFNVSNLNLDEIIHFNHKGINIYPDKSKKPPAGQGLNRRFQITLHNIYPRVKNYRQ